MNRKLIITALVALVAVGTAQAAYETVVTKVYNGSPAAGPESWTLTATCVDDVVATFTEMNIASVHNVWDALGSKTVYADDWVDSVVMDDAWAVYDTYFLFDAIDMVEVGSLDETNDATNPAGLSLATVAMPAFLAQCGMGSFGHLAAGIQSTSLPGALRASSVAFMQVVLPTGSSALLNVDILSGSGGGTGGNDPVRTEIREYVIPEPATMALLTLGGLSLLARKRR